MFLCPPSSCPKFVLGQWNLMQRVYPVIVQKVSRMKDFQIQHLSLVLRIEHSILDCFHRPWTWPEIRELGNMTKRDGCGRVLDVGGPFLTNICPPSTRLVWVTPSGFIWRNKGYKGWETLQPWLFWASSLVWPSLLLRFLDAIRFHIMKQ